MSATTHARVHDLPLCSKLLDWLNDNTQVFATAQQWQGMLNNLQGIRREEIEQAGLLNFLSKSEPGCRISRGDLIEEAQNNLILCSPTIQSHWKRTFRPSLNMATMVDQLPDRIEAQARRFVDKAVTSYRHPSMGYWIIETCYEDLATVAPNWIVLDDKGKLILSHEQHGGWFPTAIEAFDEMHRCLRKRFDDCGRERPITIFDEYALMEGRNYQEWFVCLPYWHLTYSDDHFKVDQLLIHIRTTKRIDDDGRRLLMIEELQSPWHADLKKYESTMDDLDDWDDDPVADAPFAKEWHELGIKAAIWLAIRQGITQIGFTTGRQQCDRWGNLEGLVNLYDQQIPKCLKKIATQFDCINDWTTISTRKPAGRIRHTRQGKWQIQDSKRTPTSPSLQNKDIALLYLNKRSTPVKEKVRTLHVSEKLRRAMIGNAIPLFGW